MDPYPYYGGPTSRSVKPKVRRTARAITFTYIGILIYGMTQTGSLGLIILAATAACIGIFVIYRIVQSRRHKQKQLTMSHTPPPPPNHEISR